MQQPATTNEKHAVTFLVVGGGIAGVTCAETLAVCCPDQSILLLTESSVIKTIANLEPVARFLYKFDVKERAAAAGGLAPAILTIVDQLKELDSHARQVETFGKRVISYQYLCLCTGGQPRLISGDQQRVLGIRDTDSVLELERRLKHAQRIVLVGNGGIASELAYELKNIEVHWVIKDKHISSTFVDPGAAHFFQQSLANSDVATTTTPTAPTAIKRLRYDETLPAAAASEKRGAALGPDWHRNFVLSGQQLGAAQKAPIIHYDAHIKQLSTVGNQLTVSLTNGELLCCDFVVSATGVEPRHDYVFDQALALADDGGIAVNEMMETNLPHIYAAGDVCTANWAFAPHWFQMRLWTQARQMGSMAGRSMAAAFEKETIYQDFCFELFGHVTQLFGFSVVLLGRYNGQGLGTDYELLLRTTPGKEYIKFVLQRGRLRGAILIGNTELAETCENLILNGIDLTPFGDDILNPDIDIEDYFD